MPIKITSVTCHALLTLYAQMPPRHSYRLPPSRTYSLLISAVPLHFNDLRWQDEGIFQRWFRFISFCLARLPCTRYDKRRLPERYAFTYHVRIPSFPKLTHHMSQPVCFIHAATYYCRFKGWHVPIFEPRGHKRWWCCQINAHIILDTRMKAQYAAIITDYIYTTHWGLPDIFAMPRRLPHYRPYFYFKFPKLLISTSNT